MLSPIEQFVEKVCKIVGVHSNDFPKAVDRYLDLLESETDFRKLNFEYLMQNFEKHNLFERDKYKEISEHKHNFILSILWQFNSGLAGFIAFCIKGGDELEEYELDEDGELIGDGPFSMSEEDRIRELLPSKTYDNTFPFEEMRSIQRGIFDMLEHHLTNPEITDIIIDAPTGVGKSGIAIANLLKSKTGYLVTANKSLQNQYVTEFPWLSDLRGRANYRCNEYDGFDCRSSPCQKSKSSRKECAQKGSCDYGEAKVRALKSSSYSLMNMHTMISYAIYALKSIDERQIMIIDEAHSFPEVISSSVGLSLSLKALVPFGIKEIPHYFKPESYQGWLNEVYDTIKADDESLSEEETQLVDKIGYILSQLNSGNLALDLEKDIHDSSIITCLKMHPVRVEKYYQNICAIAPIRIHLSATILGYETYCNMLGIKSENVAIIRASSPFHKDIRPIYANYSVGKINMGSLNSLLPKMVDRIEYIMDHYADNKGIIHGVTYNICNNIYSSIRPDLRPRLLFPRSAKEQGECLARHKQSKNTVLLSPSMTEGVDLKNDLSRFQILAKVPYPYLGDPLIQKRKETYYGYYEMLTATTIMQSYGRSTRNESDWCHTFVLDDSFKWFVKANTNILPPWFTEAITW